jgi:hypothetical protein
MTLELDEDLTSLRNNTRIKQDGENTTVELVIDLDPLDRCVQSATSPRWHWNLIDQPEPEGAAVSHVP